MPVVLHRRIAGCKFGDFGMGAPLVFLALFGAHLTYKAPSVKTLLATIEALQSQLDAANLELAECRAAAKTGGAGLHTRRLLSVASKPVPFALGLYNFCPRGAFRIDTEAECSVAAGHYNWTFVASAPDENLPTGCYSHYLRLDSGAYSAKTVRFNAAAIGSRAQDPLVVAVPLCTARGLYPLGSPGTTLCISGSEAITNETECAGVALARNEPFLTPEKASKDYDRAITPAMYPTGCFRLDIFQMAALYPEAALYTEHYNSYPFGKSNEDATPICKNVDAFLLGTEGLAACPVNSVSIQSEDDCRNAAAYLDPRGPFPLLSGSWGTFNRAESAADYPKGCYLYNTPAVEKAYLEVFFNAHATGAPNPFATPICMHKFEPRTPSPTRPGDTNAPTTLAPTSLPSLAPSFSPADDPLGVDLLQYRKTDGEVQTWSCSQDCYGPRSQTSCVLFVRFMAGPLPTELRNLSCRDRISQIAGQGTISNRNVINGTLDVLASLRGLTAITLNDNRITGNVNSLASLTKLKSLIVFGNLISGVLDALTVLTTLTSLRVHDNLFEGTVPQALQKITCAKSIVCLEFFPPKTFCGNPSFKRIDYVPSIRFGTCVPRLKPTFTAYEARRELVVSVRKQFPSSSTSTSLAVLAVNLGDGDDTFPKNSWRLNGLTPNASEATPIIRCGFAQLCVYPERCQTIWLNSPNCAVFNDTHLQVLHEGNSSFDDSAVVLTVRASSSGLPEGRYPFVLQLPVTDSVSWTYSTLSGSVSVEAVADAMFSELRLVGFEAAAKQTAARSEPKFCDNAAVGCMTIPDVEMETSEQGNRRIEIDITAKDCDGFELNRTGEEIYVSVQVPGSTAISVLIAYDPKSGSYRGEIGTFSLLGKHAILMKTASASAAVLKAQFHLVCANGYIANEARTACVQQARDIRRILAVVLAMLMLCAVGYALWFVKKRPGRAYALVLTVLNGEFLLALAFSLELLDLLSDAMMVSTVMSSDEVIVAPLQIPFCIFFGTAILASLSNSAVTIRLFLKQRAQRQRDLLLDGHEPSDDSTSLLALEQELVSTGRDLSKAYMAILLAALEDIPLGILAALLIHRQSAHPTPMQLVSIVTSALSVGLKYARSFPSQVLPCPRRSQRFVSVAGWARSPVFN